jgi:hypothetical protein
LARPSFSGPSSRCLLPAWLGADYTNPSRLPWFLSLLLEFITTAGKGLRKSGEMGYRGHAAELHRKLILIQPFFIVDRTGLGRAVPDSLPEPRPRDWFCKAPVYPQFISNGFSLCSRGVTGWLSARLHKFGEVFGRSSAGWPGRYASGSGHESPAWIPGRVKSGPPIKRMAWPWRRCRNS